MKTRALISTTLLAALLICSFTALAADPIQFSPADSYPLSATMFRMTSGDFNKDGWPDLAVVQDNTKYSILMNNGAGGFTTATYTITGSRLKDVAVVNLAGDTIPDLVMSDYLGFVRVLTGVGNGTFTLSASVGITANSAQGIAAGDFNGDGYPDAAVCMFGSNKVGVLLGTAGGGLGAPAYSNTGTCDDLAVGLVNADGYQDLVTANWSTSDISVLLGNGNGTFGTEARYAVGGNATDVALADINHDGNLDAVVAAYSINKAVIMLGNGAGVFTLNQSLSTVRGAQQIRVADFNLDGFLDIATANASAAPGMALLQATGYNTFMSAATFHADQAANGLAIADFNHDTGLDVATSHTNNTVRVMKVVPSDTDGDGMLDSWEEQYPCVNPLVGDSALDPDGDGLKNLDEDRHGSNPCLADTDGDGLNDGDEVNLYSTDPAKADTDGDGMPDGWEVMQTCVNPLLADGGLDPDMDLLTNLQEYQRGADPCVYDDTDGDGMPDGWELQYACVDRLVNDAGLDPDADTLTNLQEYQALTNPCVANDTDGDGMPDWWELLQPCLIWNMPDAFFDPDDDQATSGEEFAHGTDPCLADTDGDGMTDGWEILFASCGLNPHVNDAGADPDADTITNLQEFQGATNPCVPNDTDNDGMPDIWELAHPCMIWNMPDAFFDPDGDQATSGEEYAHGTDPCLADTDGDGMPDGWEILYSSCGLNPNVNDAALDPDNDLATNLQEYQASTNPCLPPDADGDGMPDVWELAHPCLDAYVNDANLDSDSDLLSNLQEYELGTDPCGFTDSDSDGMPDGYESAHACLDRLTPDAEADPDGDGGNNLLEYQGGGDPCAPEPGWHYPATFMGEVSYPVDSRSIRMATGDFNRDGFEDIVVVNNSSRYSILLNQGNRTFTATSYVGGSGGSYLMDVVVIQLAGDNIPDLAFSDGGSFTLSMRVLRGNGDGTFTATGSYATGYYPQGLASADFNGDGWPDIALCNGVVGGVLIYLGNSGGGFQAATSYSTGLGTYCIELAAGQVDSDPNPDLIIADWDGDKISVLLGNGAGGLSAPTILAVGNDNNDVALGDLDGDGKLDAAVSAYAANAVMVLKGDGAGGFHLLQSIPVGTQPHQVRLGDFNGDGWLDIAATNSGAAPGLSLIFGYGHGFFSGKYDFYSDQSATGLAIADFDHAGPLDVATSHPGANTIRVMFGMRTDSDLDVLADVEETAKGTNPANPDTDGDGLPDGFEDHAVCLDPLINDSALDPDGDFSSSLFEYQHGLDPCAFNDTDGDGMPDGWEVAHPCMNPYLNDAGSDYDQDVWTSLYEYQHATDPCFAEDTDLDGMPDGWEDLYASCGLDKYLDDADLDPDADTKTNLEEYQAHTNPCVVNDTDNDGMPDHYEVLHPCLNPAVNDAGLDPDGDLLTNLQEYQRGADPCVYTDTDSDGMSDGWELQQPCLNPLVDDAALDPDGDGMDNLDEYGLGTNPCASDSPWPPIWFSAADIYSLTGTKPADMAASDFNLDGYPDFVTANDTNTYSIFINNGSGGFTSATYTAGGRLIDVAVVNLAGDAFPDLVFEDYDNVSLVVLSGNGDGTFALHSTISSSGVGLAAGDFNGDGYPDVAKCSSSVYILLGNSGGSFDPLTSYSLPNPGYSLTVGLVNADGAQDLVVASRYTSEIYVLLGNGSGGFGSPTVVPMEGGGKTGVALGDINGDGKTDAVVADFDGLQVQVLLGDGAGGFTLSKSIAVGNQPLEVQLGDLNGDGWLDIATANSVGPPGLSVILNYGYGNFTSAFNYHNDLAALSLAMVDVNPASRRDIVTTHYNAHVVRVLKDVIIDTDADVLADPEEVLAGTNPNNPDTDGDGMRDGLEVRFACLDPLAGDSLLDADSDGLANGLELRKGLDPCSADTDGDGLPDGWEVQYHGCGFNPYSAGSEFRSARLATEVALTSDSRIDSSFPSLAWTGSEFGMSWKKDFSAFGAGPPQLFFGRVSAAGTRIGADLRITAADHSANFPSLAWTGSEYGLSWVDNRNGHFEVYFARLSPMGAMIGPETRISALPYNYCDSSSLVWTGSEFGLSWEDYRDMTTQIYFVRVSAAGAKIGTEIKISADTTMAEDPSLSWTGSEFGVSWDQPNQGWWDIYFARISAAGIALGSNLRVTADGQDNAWSRLAWAGSEFGLSWEKEETGVPSWTSTESIYFTRLSATGTKLGADLRLTLPYEYDANEHPALAWTGSVFGVAWTKYEPGGFNGEKNIYFTMLAPSGERFGPVQRVNRNMTFDNFNSLLAWTGSELGLGWSSTYNKMYGLSADIYFTRLADDLYTDKDGDGLHEEEEYALGANPCEGDMDADGLSDGAEEKIYGTSPFMPDSDLDGLNDYAEVITYHTNPLSWDSDGDRLPDGFEAANVGHPGGGLDPMNALDAAADFDGDGNSNGNEYWNGSDPWVKDPVPGVYANPGCYYWADGDGDGIPAPSDIVMLRLEIAGAGQEYRFILPHGTDTLDLDRDGYAAPADLILLKLMVAGSERPGGYDSQASALEVVAAPSGSVAAGATTHVTVSVHSVGGTVAFAAGFGVVFEVVSGNAVLLGGDGTADGEAAGNRYDISMEAASGARANMVVLVTGPGPVTIGAKVPGCGTYPNGRWNDEVVLGAGVVINGN